MDESNISSALMTVATSLAQEHADEHAVKNTLSVPKEQFIETEKNIILGSLKNTWKTVLDRMGKGQKALEEHLVLLSPTEKAQIKSELDAAAKKLEEKGMSPSLDVPSLQEELSIRNSTLLHIYKAGYECFQHQKLDEAFALFLTLTLLNSKVVDYWMALGTVQRALHSERAALYSFSLVSLLDLNNTLSRMHSAEIYLHLQEGEDALAELEALSEIIEEKKLDSLKPQLARLQEKAYSATHNK